MKFIHIADIHYGMSPRDGQKNRISKAFERIIEECNTLEIDLLLVAGDMFHVRPDEEMLREVDYLFAKLISTQVVIISGNHDYICAGDYYDTYTFADRVHVIKPGSAGIYLEELNCYVAGVSYRDKDMTEYMSAAEIVEAFPARAGAVNFLMLHGGTKNQLDINYSELGDCEYDYVALGHIHMREKIAGNVAYAGSLTGLDRTETGYHGYILGNIDEDSRNVGVRTRIFENTLLETRFEDVDVFVNEFMTVHGIRDRILAVVSDSNAYYNVALVGTRPDTDLTSMTNELLSENENIVDIADQTRENVDYSKLYIDNSTNIIGKFIEKVNQKDFDQEKKNEILRYGIEALINDN